MTVIIMLLGIMMLCTGALLVINPSTLFNFLREHSANPAIHLLAVVARLILGGLLVSQSDVSRFPAVINLLGWILIIAALFLAGIGRKKFTGLVSWVLKRFLPFGRVAGVVAMLFGGFLIYAFI